MKTDIHPTYHANSKVKCACGAKFEIGSTLESFELDICSQCHPFYTGKQKLVDTAGRVDKFRQRMQAAEKKRAEQADRDKKKVKVESVEEKMTRKAQEKEDAKEAEKAKKAEAKKEAAKKAAKKTVVSDSAKASSETKKEEKAEKPVSSEVEGKEEKEKKSEE